jgi:hypothetical protein
MFVKYTMLTSVATFIIIFFLHEYQPSTFIHLTTIYPQLHSTVIHLRNIVLQWFGKGLRSNVPGKREEMLFTKEELKKYSEATKGLYLAILGKVYDVGKGERFYGPSGSYHFFTGM